MRRSEVIVSSPSSAGPSVIRFTILVAYDSAGRRNDNDKLSTTGVELSVVAEERHPLELDEGLPALLWRRSCRGGA